MNGTNVKQRYLPFLLFLFVGSGCAALIYEIVWFQLLELVIGSSAVSMGVLLGTFMGGMCLGSLLLPRFIGRSQHPLRVYAFMELGIGVIGLILLFVMPVVGGVYTAWAGSGFFGMLVRGLVAAICLLPPTLLMGATLPAMSRWVETTPNGISWLGFFYGGNIAGAVIGSLLAGFYLLRVHDIAIATFVAAGINVAVALLSLLMASRTSYEGATSSVPASTTSGAKAVYVTIALSGMTALAAEVIWTRLLSLLFGATVYAFSLILAVFLMGLGIGSSVGSALGRNIKSPRMALGFCQFLLCAAMAWASYVLTNSLPYWPIDVTLSSDPWIKLQLDMVRAIWAMLPAAILWGASFPLALSSIAREGQDPGKLVGGVYAANTVGAIVGSMTASLMLVYFFGTQHSQQFLIALSALSAMLMLAPLAAEDDAGSKGKMNVVVTALLIAIAVGMLAYRVPPVPNALVAYGRFLPTRNGQGDVFFMGEGLQASVAVSRLSNGTLNYHNAGKVQASSDPADMRLQRMLGHLTTLIPDNQETFMVIGCGAGVTAGAVSIEPKLKSETIVEIEPLVPRVASEYFGEHNYNVIRNPKVNVVIDDGRHFLMTTKQKFDGITSDPLDPWVKGAAMLYTREFFELVKEHLNPGGVVTLFVQFYESNEDAVKSEIATFFEAFPNGAVFANTIQGSGYDVVLFGQNDDRPIDVDRMNQRLSSPEYAQVAQSLREIGFYSAVDLLATFAGRPTDLQGWLKNAAINRDRNLRLQYLAGMSLNLYQADPIYQNMISYGVKYPQSFFTGSPNILDSLRLAIDTAQFR